MTKVLILNYHRILEQEEYVDPKYKSFTLEKARFYNQIKLIYLLKIPVINLNEIGKNENKDRFCIAFTLDDGNHSDLTIAAPILLKFGFKATIFPVINNIGKSCYLSWNDLQYLKENGFTIGSHSISHTELTHLPDKLRHEEIEESKKILESKLGKSIDLFSIPFGSFNKQIIDNIAFSNYKYALSTNFGINSNSESSFILNRWNIKRNTSLFIFKKVVANNWLFVKTLQLFGKTKRYMTSRMRI